MLLRVSVLLLLVSLSACTAELDGAMGGGDEAESSFIGGGKTDLAGPGVYEAWGVLLVSNSLDRQGLDDVVRLDKRAADSISDYRAGADGVLGSADDRFIFSLETLDGLYFVGPAAYERLRDHARRMGWESPEGMRTLLSALLDHQGGEDGRGHFLLPKEGDLAAIPQDPDNPITPEKVALGRLLFHDRGLAQNPVDPENINNYSCASCHHAAGGFGSGNLQGFGEGGTGFGVHGEGRTIQEGFDKVDAQPVKTPPALNLNWQPVVLSNGALGAGGPNEGTDLLWKDGTPTAFNALGFEGVETQAIAGLAAHRLIDDEHPENTEASSLARNPEYRAMFDAAFGPDAKIDQTNVGLAIAAFERTIMSQRAPFQRFVAGEKDALNDVEVRGALRFFGSAGCVSCHTGPALNSKGFHVMGFGDMDQFDPSTGFSDESLTVAANPEANLGRASFTGRDKDRFAFKVPQLYNLRDHVAFGHGVSFTSVREVVDYMNDGASSNPRLSDVRTSLLKMSMSPADCADIAAFIEDGLYDPELHRYEPEVFPTGDCGINGDASSLEDLGCP